MYKNPISSKPSLRPRLARPLSFLFATALALPVGFIQAAPVPLASTLTLSFAWNPVPETNIQGYRLYVGTTTNQYSRFYDTGNSVSFAVGELVSGQTYYFAVKAVSSSGIEGERSAELIVPVTSKPSAVFDSYSGLTDEALTVSATGVLANDTDMDSKQLYATLFSGPANGSVVLALDGGFVYTPRPGFVGKDSFVYRATDGVYTSDPAIVEIVVKQLTVQLLVNGSFESGYQGWSATGNQHVQVSGSPYVASAGSRLVTFNDVNLLSNGVLSQSFATVPGQTYTLSFDSAVLAWNFDSQSLLIDVTGNTRLLSQTITTVGKGTGQTQWTPRTYSFVADSTLTTLAFKDTSNSTISIDLLLDNASVTGPPKPNTIPTLAETSSTPSLAGRPGAINVGMEVVNPGLYVLERSEDLANWEAIGSTQVTQPGRITFLDSKPAGVAVTKVFYRIGFR